MVALVLAVAALMQVGELPARQTPVPQTSPIVAQPIEMPASAECDWIAASDHALAPLVQVCEAGWSMHSSLPNFVCDQTTHRKEAVIQRVGSNPPRFARSEKTDVVTAEVTYRDGNEEFRDITLNARPADRDAVMKGMWTQGEFSPLWMIVLDRTIKPVLRYRGDRKIDGRPTWVFEYTVPQANNRGWVWKVPPLPPYYPPFHGEIYVDKQTGRVRRFVQQATDIAAWMGLKRVELTTDYGDVPIAQLGTYHLPVKSKSTSCWLGAGSCSENTLEFHGCRKFEVKSRILDVTQ